MLKDKTIAGLNLSAFLMMIGVGMIVSLFPQRILELEGSGEKVGYVASAFAVAYIAFQVPVGSLADRFGFKRFIALGYLLCCAAGLCFRFSSSSSMIFIGRFIQGAGEVPVWALAPALLSIKYASSKGSSIGLFNAVCYIGLTIGPILGVCLSKVCGEQEIFLIYFALCLCGAVLTLWLVEDIRPNGHSDKVDFSQVTAMTKDGLALLTLLGITLYGAGYSVLVTTLPVYLMQQKGFDHVYSGVFFSLFYIAISVSQLVTGRLSDKSGPNRYMVLGLLASSFGFAAAPYLSSRPALLAVLTVTSTGLGVFYLASMIFLNETVDERFKGTVSGAYYLFFGLGLCFGAPIFSAAAKFAGNVTALLCFAASFIALAVIMAARFFSRS